MADAYVVDTGVFLRWFVDQPGFEHARRIQRLFMDDAIRLETVDFARVEVAGVLRKKGLLAGRLNNEEFKAAVRVIDDLGVTVHPLEGDRLEHAADLSIGKSLRMYDALFAAMALDRDLPLLTSDAKLCTALDGVVETDLLEGIKD